MKLNESKEKKELFIELRALKGLSLDAICDKIDISKSTAISWEKLFKSYINQAKGAHFDFLVDSYCLSLESRLKELKDLSEKLSGMINERDFGDVPSDKLVQLQLETYKRINDLIEKHSLKESIRETGYEFMDFNP
jgi:hypothetical protein